MKSILLRLERNKEYFFLTLGGVASLMAWWTSEMSDGGADALVHFGMAQGCWKHPELLLDLWGKPLFTFFSSPFAQGGLKVHQLFNVIVGILSAFVCWKTAEKLRIASAWISIPLLCFFPVWFTLSFSTMTEPLFAFLLIASVYLYVCNKLAYSAILVSFLPFARQEGFAFIFLFALLFLLRKKFKLIPLLGSGILFFSLIGGMFLDDFFWVFNNQPYHASDQTTPGDPFHYLLNYQSLFGLAGSLLILLGCLWLLREGRTKGWDLLLLIAGGFWMVLIAHSYVYYKGQAGSIGLLRLMGTVAPLGALLAVSGMEMILSFLKLKKDRMGVIAIILLFQTASTFSVLELPLRNDLLKRTLIEFAKTVPEQDRLHTKIYSTDPQLWFYLDRDYWDKEKWVAVNHAGHYRQLTKGSLFIIENMFGHWLDIHELQKNNNVQLLYTYQPKEPLTFGHGPYCIYVLSVTK